ISSDNLQQYHRLQLTTPTCTTFEEYKGRNPRLLKIAIVPLIRDLISKFNFQLNCIGACCYKFVNGSRTKRQQKFRLGLKI
ncbi:unnamed protein product, partial [Allacma fusca]